MNPYEVLLMEVESNQLRVELAPLNPRLRNWNEFGCKRIVVEYPPAWYRRLCQRHASSRGVRRGKFDTKIKRANVLQLLSRLSRGLDSTSKYADELRAVASKRTPNPF